MSDATQTCDTVSLAPAGGRMSGEKKFWNKVAKKYAASPIKNVPAYEQTMDRTRTYLSTDDNVLEIGCGTGSTALLLADRTARLTATDISANMIDIAKAKACDAGAENVAFLEGDIFLEDLQAGSFDAILAFNLFHLVRDLPSALDRAQSLLKPGGVLISKTVCLAEQTRLWAIPISLMRMVGFAPYVNMMTFADIEGAITEAGLDVIETGLYPEPYSRFVVARKT